MAMSGMRYLIASARHHEVGQLKLMPILNADTFRHSGERLKLVGRGRLKASYDVIHRPVCLALAKFKLVLSSLARVPARDVQDPILKAFQDWF